MQEIYDILLNKIDKSQMFLNELMSKHTSFKIGGPADIFINVKTVLELKYMLEIANNDNTPLTIVRKWNKLISKRPEELEES